MTSANLDIANNGITGIADFYTLTSLNITVTSTRELFVLTGETYAPGGSLTAKDIDINGTVQFQVYTGMVSGMRDAIGKPFSSSNIFNYPSCWDN